MAISNVQMLSNASSFGAYNQKLTQTTKQKLEELGISYNSNITEQEAQKLISKYETANAQKSEQSGQQGLFSSQDQNKDENLEQLKKLAAQLGIATEEKPDFNKLIKQVEAALQEKIQASGNDINQLQYLKGLSQDLANIQSQKDGSSSSYNSSNQALMMSLEMLSQYNKNLLHR